MRDPRLNHNFGLSGYESRQEKRRAAFMEAAVGDKWDSAVDRLVAVTMANAFGATHMTGEQCPQASTDLLPEAFPLAFQRVNGAFENTSDESLRIGIDVLLEKTGRRLADELADQPEKWVVVCEHVSPWEVFAAFVEALSATSVRDHASDILKGMIGKPPSELVDMSRTRSEEKTLSTERLRELVGTHKDPWREAVAIDHLMQVARLYSRFLRLSRLLARAGAAAWWKWFDSLEPAVGDVALQDLADLDFGEDLLASVLSGGSSTLHGILVVRRLLDLWRQIDSALSRVAEPPIYQSDEAELRGHKENLRKWRESELDERVSRVATTLAKQSTAEIASVLLRNVSATHPKNRPDLAKIEGRLRRGLLKELLLAKPPDVLAAEVVGVGKAPRSVALLSACLVPFLPEAKSTESVREIILSAYERWLHPGRVDWSCPLADDELEMAWLLAGILCEEQSPSTRWRLLEQHAVTRTEGWGVVQDNVNEAIRARAHVYVVGAMATEWLVRRERQTNAVELLKMVLGGLHQWVRTLTDMVWEEHISAAMMQSWARAHLVFGERSAEELVQLVPLVDRLEWLVNSAAAYRANRGDRGAEPLPENLRIALRERIVPMLRVWELRHTTDVETRKSLLDTVEGLAS